ncbi:uncharacterized protein AKAW2_50543S [Aspergillus luchuensis]|uniref:Uncharacterized protein n=1 Tax=Aspergillus kawachii TaxID=1069201 RepID=A0A7R7WC27_ASPKA|nr:uncharacterized protein AKAW2_50543S [Aspergillus luchuensis]BCS00202.1 hypothetical protein AKAW2_50543S [Aspergillus luchuensis]
MTSEHQRGTVSAKHNRTLPGHYPQAHDESQNGTVVLSDDLPVSQPSAPGFPDSWVLVLPRCRWAASLLRDLRPARDQTGNAQGPVMCDPSPRSGSVERTII